MRGASWFALVGTLLAPSAFAAPCSAPYTSDQLLGDFSTVEDFLRNGDSDAAGKAATQMEAHIGCLADVFPNQAMLMGRAYRAIAGGLYASGNEDRGIVWFRSALAADPTFEYGTEDLPADHPVLTGYLEARKIGAGDPELVADRELAPGTHYVDGKKITAPEAQPGIPHVYQWKTAEGGVKAWLIEGNAFPDEALAAPVVADAEPADEGKKAKEPKPAKEPKVKEPKPEQVASAKEPKVKEPKPVTTSSTGYTQRVRPKEKTPLLVAGTAIGVGAAGVFYAAVQSRHAFDDATTLSDVDKFSKTTNNLVVASGVILGVGVGAFTWGVMVDAGAPIPTFTVRF